ncbi:universal stress protein [uncultured Winogradskyella sp.]|uniref:universal stress protein n=1 Tax=uncultured Winogradskyella sp. TaxID=395353 RepID=UPI002612F6D4|nr:universal stress protein [uncultured Winogradskyella sp.]
MKNVLLLTDFSDSSINAINYAMHFFKSEKCTFYIMHVHKSGSFTSDDFILSDSKTSIHDIIASKPKAKLVNLIKVLEKDFNNTKHNFETIIDFDNFIDAVNHIIKSKHIEIVILGSNGKTGAKEIIFGSNTLNIISNVNCTTLVIPEDYTHKTPKEILLPIDEKDNLHGKALLSLNSFIKKHKLNLSVLRINPQKKHKNFGFYDQSNLSNIYYTYFEVNEVPVHYATSCFIQIKGIDMTILLAYKDTFFERLFYGSKASKIRSSLKTHLLILHND